ncbi:MAG: site-specific integrase [Planctomycetota bacterium]
MSRRDFGSLKTRGDRPGFYARVTWRGVTVEKYAGIGRDVAKSNLAKLRSKLDGGADLDRACAEAFGGAPASRLTFEGASGLFLEYRKGRVKDSTRAIDAVRLRGLCAAPFGKRYLSDLRASDFVKWIEERRKAVSVATCNRDIHAASALFKWGRRMGHVAANPIRDVEKFSEKGRERETYLAATEARALVASADAVMRPVLTTAVSTGMRQGECIRLSWRSVDFDRRTIFVEPENSKSGKGRAIKISADLFAELSALHAARSVNAAALKGDDPVFRQANGKRITKTVLKKGLARALRAEEVRKAIPAEKLPKVTFHTLRHTAASLMVAAGVPIFDVSKILGHATLAMTMRYAHFAPEAGLSAVEKLGNVLALGRNGVREALAK